jgi:hypothetical protein
MGQMGGAADFKSSLTSVLKSAESSQLLRQTGAGGAQPTLDNLIEYSQTFANLVRAAHDRDVAEGKKPSVLNFTYQDWTRFVLPASVAATAQKAMSLTDKFKIAERTFSEQDFVLADLLRIRSDAKLALATTERLLGLQSFPYSNRDDALV